MLDFWFTAAQLYHVVSVVHHQSQTPVRYYMQILAEEENTCANSLELAAMLAPVAIKASAVASSLLTFKMLGTTMYQGSVRFRTGFRPPEDQGLMANSEKAGQNYGAASDTVRTDKERELYEKSLKEETRWVRIIQNDMENIPVGMIVMWGAALSPMSSVVHAVAAGTFCAARYAHTYAYANSLQPHRALAWTAGVLSVLTLGVNGLIGAMVLL